MFDLIIKNGTLYDGTGKKPFQADIGIRNGIIEEIGNLEGAESGEVIDACGRCVTPGFIDMHSHADLGIIQYPDAESLLGQGITTAFTGQCGMGMAPVGKYWKSQADDLFAFEDFMPFSSVSTLPGITPACLTEQLKPAYKKYFGIDMDWVTFGDFRERIKKQGTGVNLAMEVGLQQIRQQVLGMDSERHATEKEIQAMEAMVKEAMDSGAFGMSIGFEYTPDMFAGEEELYRLAACVKPYDGIVAAHTRRSRSDNPAWQPIDGMKELMELGRKTGCRVHISHIHPGHILMPPDRKMSDASARIVLDTIDEYRQQGVCVTWDVLHQKCQAFYFYPELCSPLSYYILACGGKTPFGEMLKDETYRTYVIAQMKAKKHILFPRLEFNVPVSRCSNQAYVGKTLQELAETAGISPEEMVIKILMEDMDTLIRPIFPFERYIGLESKVFWEAEEAAIGTDNAVFNYDYEGHMPDLPAFRSTSTSYCGFIHFLVESKDAPLEKTVQKLTGNAAEILRLKDRGYLKKGCCADIVIMEPERLDPNENFFDPRQQPKGIDYVIVNGSVAVDHGVHTHVRSGRVLQPR